jgi:hypothetical protein
MFEKAKQQLIDEFDWCHLRVLLFVRATHSDNSTETIKLRLKQLDRLHESYKGKVPAEQMAHLICTWAPESELLMYIKMREHEKALIVLALCTQCRRIKAMNKKEEEYQNIMFNPN